MGRLMTENELREADRIRKADVGMLIVELAKRGHYLTNTQVIRSRTMTNLLRSLGIENPDKTSIIMAVGAARWWREVARRRTKKHPSA